MSLYLILNIASFIVPFLYSFEKRMQYIKRWKIVFSSILITAAVFIVWDIFFTKMGVWSFNPRYHAGIEFFHLPLEEWLFFICIPYASLFIHFAFCYFFPKTSLSETTVKRIYFLLILVVLPVFLLHLEKWYTAVNYGFFMFILTIAFWKFPKILATFFLTFLIILVPFLIVNGILTGSFIEEPVVIYNNNENLGIRLGTIPIEDVAYAFSMLLMSLLLIGQMESSQKEL